MTVAEISPCVDTAGAVVYEGKDFYLLRLTIELDWNYYTRVFGEGTARYVLLSKIVYSGHCDFTLKKWFKYNRQKTQIFSLFELHNHKV